MLQKNIKLTLQQEKTLKAIESFFKQYQFFPSVRDLAKVLKIQSPNTIFSHLKGLHNKGYLQKNHKGQIINISYPKNTSVNLEFGSNLVLGRGLEPPCF